MNQARFMSELMQNKHDTVGVSLLTVFVNLDSSFRWRQGKNDLQWLDPLPEIADGITSVYLRYRLFRFLKSIFRNVYSLVVSSGYYDKANR